MSTIIASQIPANITQDRVDKFFSFCGDIQSTKLIEKVEKVQSFEITFKSEKALETALLLNEAELDGVPIKVTQKTGATAPVTSASTTTTASRDVTEEGVPPPLYSAVGGKVPSTVGDHKVQHDNDDDEEDIQQEEKPKYVIVTQLLANGYTLSDKIIGQLIEYDKQKGISAKFKTFLGGLDEKYVHSQEPESDFNKNLGKAQDKLADLQTQVVNSPLANKYSKKVSKYYEQAASHPYGAKVHDFYKVFAKDVKDVHQEAKRISDLHKAQATAGTTTDASTSASATTTTAAPLDAKK